MKTVSIIGSGNWAQALSKLLLPAQFFIKCRDIKKERKKFKSKKIILTDSFSDILNTDVIFLAIPSQSVRDNLKKFRKLKVKAKRVVDVIPANSTTKILKATQLIGYFITICN